MNEQFLDVTRRASTLVELLRLRALCQPNELAYRYLADGETEEVCLSYQELELRARAVGAALQSSVAAGDRILLLLPPGLEYVAAFFGCLFAGAVAVPAYPPQPNEKLQTLKAIADDARAIWGITTSTILTRLESQTPREPSLAVLRWLVLDRMEAGWHAEWKDPCPRKDVLAVIQYTSGSTSEPKGVMVSHENLLNSSAIIHRRFGHSEGSRGVIWLPPYHDMGLVGGVIQPLFGGFPVTLMSPAAFLLRPVRWLQAISRHRATTSGGPNFAYDLCARRITPEQRSAIDLSCWEVAFNGAEPVRRETLDRFAAAFAECGFKREAFYPCYGLAEATLLVAGGLKKTLPVVCSVEEDALRHDRIVPADGRSTARNFVACGQASPDFEVVIVDPERLTRLAPDQVGEIWVSGSGIALGYWNRKEETDRSFRAYTADTGEGPFLRTGDMGFFVDGHLVISGRLKDLIILAGRNHYPEDIERTVEQAHPSLQADGSAAFSVDIDGQERLVIMVETPHKTRRTDSSFDADQVVQIVRQSVAAHHGLHVHRIVLLKRGSIPKTTSGKIRRNACRSMFLKSGETGSQIPIHGHEMEFYG